MGAAKEPKNWLELVKSESIAGGDCKSRQHTGEAKERSFAKLISIILLEEIYLSFFYAK